MYAEGYNKGITKKKRRKRVLICLSDTRLYKSDAGGRTADKNTYG